jgi:hypothetical protein
VDTLSFHIIKVIEQVNLRDLLKPNGVTLTNMVAA